MASFKEQNSVGSQENEELIRRNEELQAQLDSVTQDMESMQWQNARQIQDLQEKNKRLSEGKEKMWNELSNVKQQMQLLCDMLECSCVMGLYSAVQQCQTQMFEAQEEADYFRKELQSKTLAAEAQQTHLTELQAQLLRERQEYEYKLEKEKRKFCNDREKWGEKEYALIEAIQNQSRKLVKGSSNKNNHSSSDASNSTDSGSSLMERPSKFQNQISPYSSGPSPPISPLPIHQTPYSPYHPPASPCLSRPQTPQSGAYRPLFGQYSQNMHSFRGAYGSNKNVLQDGSVESTLEAQGSSSDPALSRAAERVRKLQHNASVFARN